jgi:hypothetical protein
MRKPAENAENRGFLVLNFRIGVTQQYCSGAC